jgi:hypothetical protein
MAARIEPVVARTFAQCMELLQEGYVSSVAATAGCTVEKQHYDVNGLDVLLVRPGRSPQDEEISVFAQLKNTTTFKPNLDRATFSYQFKSASLSRDWRLDVNA